MTSFYLLRSVVLIILGLLIYAQTFSYGFVFDDHIFIVTNPYIKNFDNFHLMWQAFPMTRLIGMLSFALNYHFNQLNPWGYHLFNFAVHLVTSFLVWALADMLFTVIPAQGRRDRISKELPFLIAVIFLVHPCQTQAVSYITQRFESMAALFYLGATYAYLRARVSTKKMQQVALFGLSAVLTVLGIMTKETVMTIPLMLLAFEWILFPQKNPRDVYILLGMGGVLLFALFFKLLHSGFGILWQKIYSESHDGDVLTPIHYFLTQMRVFLTFCRLMVFPINQNVDYDYPVSTSVLDPPLTLLGGLVIIGVVFLVQRFRRKIPLIALGMVWGLITFSINLAPRSNVIFEHKLYLISFGFILTFVTALSLWVPNHRTLFKLLWCLIAVLAFLSFQRNKVWANELVLWQDTIIKSPHKARVNANLGRMYAAQGNYGKAIEYLSRSIVLKGDNITYENRGIIYGQEGQFERALADFNTSIAMDPNYFITYIKRSWIYQNQHRDQAALDDLAHAISLNPYFVDAYIERGMFWVYKNNLAEALKDFNTSLKIDPYNKQANQYKDYCLSKIDSQSLPAGRR